MARVGRLACSQAVDFDSRISLSTKVFATKLGPTICNFPEYTLLTSFIMACALVTKQQTDRFTSQWGSKKKKVLCFTFMLVKLINPI
jgi:hypothetical protein